MFATTVSFFPEKTFQRLDGGETQLLSAAGQTELIPSILDGTFKKSSDHQPSHQPKLLLAGYFGDTFENTGKHFSDLAANDFGVFLAGGIRDGIMRYFGLCVQWQLRIFPTGQFRVIPAALLHALESIRPRRIYKDDRIAMLVQLRLKQQRRIPDIRLDFRIVRRRFHQTLALLIDDRMNQSFQSCALRRKVEDLARTADRSIEPFGSKTIFPHHCFSVCFTVSSR